MSKKETLQSCLNKQVATPKQNSQLPSFMSRRSGDSNCFDVRRKKDSVSFGGTEKVGTVLNLLNQTLQTKGNAGGQLYPSESPQKKGRRGAVIIDPAWDTLKKPRKNSYEIGLDEEVSQMQIGRSQGAIISHLFRVGKSKQRQRYEEAQQRIVIDFSQDATESKHCDQQNHLKAEYDQEFYSEIQQENYNVILKLVTGWDELIQNHIFYFDIYAMLTIRKWLALLLGAISQTFLEISTNKYFNLMMLFFVSCNLVLYITKFYGNLYSEHREVFDLLSFTYFWIYCVEYLIKFFGDGPVAFFGEVWKVYDLVNLILFALYQYNVLQVDLSPLISIRILIFLRHISIDIHQVLTALRLALKPLIEASLIVLIFCVFFANAGVHLFNGLSQNRCFDLASGITSSQLCGFIECPSKQICVSTLATNIDLQRFDTFMYGFVQIVKTITIDDWTHMMYQTMYTMSPVTWIYFIFVIFIVGFFAFNIIIAVLKTSYSQIISAESQKLSQESNDRIELDLRTIKQHGLYNSLKTLQKARFYALRTKRAMSHSFIAFQMIFKSPTNPSEGVSRKPRHSVASVALGELSKISKFVRRAQALKENKNQARLVLSARQQRYLEEKNYLKKETKQRWFERFNIKSILLPKRNLPLELKDCQCEESDSLEIKRILYFLRRQDILAWKIDVAYRDYKSSSEMEVLLASKIIKLKQDELFHMCAEINNIKIPHRYILFPEKQTDTGKDSKCDYNNRFSTTLYTKEGLRIGSRRFPLKPGRGQLLTKTPKHFTLRQIFTMLTSKQDKKVQKYKKSKTSKMSSHFHAVRYQQEKVDSEPFDSSLYEWQEGEQYILINKERQNYKSIQRLINREILEPEYFEEQSIEQGNLADLEKYLRLRALEIQTGHISSHNLSINNIVKLKFRKLISILRSLNEFNSSRWLLGVAGKMIIIQRSALMIIKNKSVTILFDCFAFINILVIALFGLISDEVIWNLNNIFTFLFLGEVGLKIIGLGAKRFALLNHNVLDSVILIISMLQLVAHEHEGSFLKQFSSELSSLRAFKGFLLYRVIKYNLFITKIMRIAKKTFSSYLSITFLMFFVVLLFAVIGQSFFGNLIDESKQLGQIRNFNSIGKSWITVFNIMTNDNAFGVAQVGSVYYDETIGIGFYLITVFTINYLLFGLISAILLDAFSSELEKSAKDELDYLKNFEELGIQERLEGKDLVNYFDHESNENEGLQEVNLRPESEYLETEEIEIPQVGKNIFAIYDKQSQNFEYIECEYSLYYFSKKNKIRKACYYLTRSPIYQRCFNIIICSSVSALVLRSFLKNVPPLHIFQFETIFDYHLLGVNITIVLSYTLQIITKGMLLDKGAFCRDLWRFLDIIYLISYFSRFGSQNQFLEKTLYLIYMRPFIMINMFESVQGIKNAMFLSLAQILNVFGVLILIFSVFVIYGIHLFREKMGFCENLMNFYVNKAQCQSEGKHWIVYFYNFDNFINGLLTLFVSASFDGWGETMQVCMNSDSAEFGPSPLNNQWVSYLFFVLFIFIGAMFFMGFLIGVLFNEFQKYTRSMKSKNLTLEQIQFLKIAQLILAKTPAYSDPPNNTIRKLCFALVFSKLYNYYFLSILAINTVDLCLFHYFEESELLSLLNYTYQGLSLLFIMDSILKLLAYGVRRYFSTLWRDIELILSVIALADLFCDIKFGWVQSYFATNINDPFFTIYRLVFVLRDLRTLLVIQEFKGLSRLLRVLEFSAPLLSKILYIQVITQTTYALIGEQLFGHITKGNIIDQYYSNFANSINAALLLFKCTTIDDWKSLLVDCSPQNPYCKYDSSQCGSNWAYPFFLSYYLISSILIMNLFLLVLVEQFEQFFNSSTNVIQAYVEGIDHFCNIWSKYTFEKKGAKMHYRHIAKFLLELGEPLGSQRGDNIWDTAKSAFNFRLRADEEGFVTFTELLYEAMHFAFKEQVFKRGSRKSRKQMKRFDQELKKKISSCPSRSAVRGASEISLNLKGQGLKMSVKKKQKHEYCNFNILCEYINILIAFKTWEAYKRLIFERTANGIFDYTEQFSESYQYCVSEGRILVNQNHEDQRKDVSIMEPGQDDELKFDTFRFEEMHVLQGRMVLQPSVGPSTHAITVLHRGSRAQQGYDIILHQD